jgi:hypothetical protein
VREQAGPEQKNSNSGTTHIASPRLNLRRVLCRRPAARAIATNILAVVWG